MLCNLASATGDRAVSPSVSYRRPCSITERQLQAAFRANDVSKLDAVVLVTPPVGYAV